MESKIRHKWTELRSRNRLTDERVDGWLPSGRWGGEGRIESLRWADATVIQRMLYCHTKNGWRARSSCIAQGNCCSAAQSCPALCDPMGRKVHARLPCPSLPPTARSDSCPLSQWCHPGNYIQSPEVSHNGKENKKEYMCACVYVCVRVRITELLCYIAETTTTL